MLRNARFLREMINLFLFQDPDLWKVRSVNYLEEGECGIPGFLVESTR